jgi:hypothetical protein
MNIHYNKNLAQLNGNSLFSGKNFAKLDDWNQLINDAERTEEIIYQMEESLDKCRF